jgi:hypothetical protein
MVHNARRPFCCVPNIEVELGTIGFTTKVRVRVTRELHAIDDAGTTMLQNNILRDANYAQAISDLPQAWAYAFTKDVVHSTHTFRANDETTQQQCSLT